VDTKKDTAVPDPRPNLSKQELSRKVSSGAVFLISAAFFTRLFSLATAIILARLLAPEDFGLMALVFSIIVLTQSATTTGFDAALIQKKDYEDLLDTAWTLEIFRYSLIALFLYFSAPLFALIFDVPGSVPILRLLAASLLFLGFQNIGVHLVRKELDFRKQAVIELIPSITYSLVTIVLAILLRSVWALAYGLLARNATLFFLSYLVHPFRPRFRFQIHSARELVHFGKWVFGVGLLVMLKEQGIVMFMGKFFGTTVLGFYDRGLAFSSLIFKQVRNVAWRIGFPLFSLIQDEHDDLRDIFTKAFHLACLISFPMAMGLYNISEEFTLVFLTLKWIEIVPYIKILSCYGLISIILTPCAILFHSKGVPHITAKIGAVELLVFALLVPVSLLTSPIFIPLALLLTTLVFFPVRLYFASKILGIKSRIFLKYLLVPLGNSAVMFFCLYWWKRANFLETGLVNFLSLIFLGVITYTVMTIATDVIFKLNSIGLLVGRFRALLPVNQEN